MSCKKCRHWFVNPNIVIPGEPTEGKCLVSEIKTQSNHVCNAWELSQVAEWKDENERLKEELRHEKTRSQLNLEAEERRMLNITHYCAEIDRLNARVAELEAERRWKDSNVELPKEDTDGNALLVICRYSGEWARAPFGIEFSDEFVRHYSHWMIAPKLPEVQE